MKFRVVILAAIAVAATAVIYSRSRGPRNPSAQAASSAQGSQPGQFAPDFELPALDGRTVKLSAHRGQPVLVNFWATWCAPCRIEMPWLVEFYKQYQPLGLEILGVNMDDPGAKEDVAKFAAERNVNYTILRGNDSVGNAYGGVPFMPQTFFIGRDGRIVKSTVGIQNKKRFDDDIKQLIGQEAQR